MSGPSQFRPYRCVLILLRKPGRTSNAQVGRFILWREVAASRRRHREQKGGSGKSTFAMHILVALLKAGKRVASFDLDLNQLTLTRYLGNRHEWVRKHEQKLELPDHYPVTEQVHGTTLVRFISRLKKIGRTHKDDFTGSSALSHS